MKLSDDQLEQFKQALLERLPNNSTCPMCGSPKEQWWPYNVVVAGEEYEAYSGEFETQPPDDFAFLTVHCSRCGYVMYFNAVILGFLGRTDILDEDLVTALLSHLETEGEVDTIDRLPAERHDTDDVHRHVSVLIIEHYVTGDTRLINGQRRAFGPFALTEKGRQFLADT